MSKPKRIKRIYIVNRDFQFKYAKLALLIGLISTTLTFFLVLFPLHYLGMIRVPGFLPPPFMIGISLAAFANFVLVTLGTIVLTHRIAGPMFSLVRNMKQIQDGRWNAPLQVRQNDDLQYVVRNFNDLVEYLLNQTSKDRETLQTIDEAIKGNNPSQALSQVNGMLQDIDKRHQRNQKKMESTND